ncbi:MULTISPECIES: phosphatase PAP2 family protein [Flavobacterium]|uniref:Phosphatase PAP2 family protein n=1 Tax=Flavobacterium lipolyticum TaxID=2893754 RepID=A0ABS8M783_9FLAO|nr:MULTISPECIES: phosphatase PAP2 family protein [unclassified Flavobacterium]MCC9020643.1 phosphatase PAP2 family protein [Flavobacterium sp. F-126]
MNTSIIKNYSKLKFSLYFLPLFCLAALVLFLYYENALSVYNYAQIQKSTFLYINSHLGLYPNLQYNLTQLGDASIFLSFLALFILYAPKLWEALLSGLLFSLLFSCPLKAIFGVPRPAVIFNNEITCIMGRKLCGFNSLPSGHSIVVFTVLTIILFAFMPQRLKFKILWSVSIITIGFILAFTRVGVGAHYPLDVITGSILGYISGISGIFISRKYKIGAWINNDKYYPIFIALFIICCICLVGKIIKENLIIYYLSFISLAVSLYKITYVYVKK